MAKPIHSMIRVFDPEKSISFYQLALGMRVEARYDFANFSLFYLRGEDNVFELELTYNHEQATPYEQGNAYGHLAVTVDDLEQHHQFLLDSGLSPTDIKTMSYEETPMASFFFITDPDGYKIEVLKRFGRFL
ncbi:VOC family protein [Enterovibrio calviensis]|uniref:VOC family protein n=1 Tax=Enterovibrio calviensis TaxID=91359 RepID=UPI0004880246|nr:VOC family protein [Enterovibrio calviensis]